MLGVPKHEACVHAAMLMRSVAAWQDNLMEAIGAKEQAAKQVSWMDSILSLIPGRKQTASSEPSDEAIKRTHDYLRCRCSG